MIHSQAVQFEKVYCWKMTTTICFSGPLIRSPCLWAGIRTGCLHVVASHRLTHSKLLVSNFGIFSPFCQRGRDQLVLQHPFPGFQAPAGGLSYCLPGLFSGWWGKVQTQKLLRKEEERQMSGLGFMSGAELELTWPPNKVPTTRGSSVVGRSASPVIFCHCICFPSIWTCHRHFIWSMISQGLLEGEHSSILCLGLKAVWLHENPDRFGFPAKLFIPCNDLDYIR